MLEMADALREVQLTMPSPERDRVIAEADNYLSKIKQISK